MKEWLKVLFTPRSEIQEFKMKMRMKNILFMIEEEISNELKKEIKQLKERIAKLEKHETNDARLAAVNTSFADLCSLQYL